MRPKHLIAIVVLVGVLTVVIVVGLRRILHPSPVNPSPGAPSESTETAPLVAAAAFEAADAQAAGPDPALTGGIDGLYLQLSRALTFDLAQVRGLAATESWFYVASVDTARHTGMVIQVSREHYGIVQTRELVQDGRYRLGGLHMGASGLWVPLAGTDDDAHTTIALLELTYLGVHSSIEVDGHIRAVAQTSDKEIVGVSEDGQTLYAWNLRGRKLRSATNLSDVVYHDLAWVRGSLVAAGVSRQGDYAVLDVLDPASLTLLTRHHVYARSASGSWVTAGGFDVCRDRFLMLPQGGSRPSLLTYALLNGTIDSYVPATQP